ncbi:MAG: Stp1/IreP family PP2C-type Ser/Thr phosphatase [Coriobacteriia bacterium]|nr:Stp1/IreP family PP2C-type Ser/Thr phosphatase [Coriobacteriia bacterium]
MRARPGKRTYAGLTDVGRVRAHNEDSVLLEQPLFAVADGLGGHEAGEVASGIAVTALRDAAPAHADANALGRAVRAANRAVIKAAREGRGREGMGTTLTAAIVEGTRIVVAHVGDSRAYLLHGDTMERITGDHSMVADMIRQGTLTEEESRSHPNRSVITRALGTDPNMYADTYEVDAEPGDRLLICSDGLTGMLTDDRIADLLGHYGDPEMAVRELVDAANEAGGHDNVSVVVVDIVGERASTEPARSHRGWLAVLVWALAVAAVVGIAVWGTYRYAADRAYLVAENDVVVVYRGLPGEFAGISLRWLAEETTITVGLLDPVTAGRLAQGIPVEDLDAANALVAQYRAIAEARSGDVDSAPGGP